MKITNPIMAFTNRFYQDDVRRGTAVILRRRTIAAEVARAWRRHRELVARSKARGVTT